MKLRRFDRKYVIGCHATVYIVYIGCHATVYIVYIVYIGCHATVYIVYNKLDALKNLQSFSYKKVYCSYWKKCKYIQCYSVKVYRCIMKTLRFRKMLRLEKI